MDQIWQPMCLKPNCKFKSQYLHSFSSHACMRCLFYSPEMRMMISIHTKRNASISSKVLLLDMNAASYHFIAVLTWMSKLVLGMCHVILFGCGPNNLAFHSAFKSTSWPGLWLFIAMLVGWLVACFTCTPNSIELVNWGTWHRC